MMKVHFKILLLLLTASLLNCSNEDVYVSPRPDYWGEANMELNGGSYEVLPYAYWSAFNENTLTISLDRRNLNDEMRESLNIFNVPQQIGSYKITTGILEPQETGVGSLLGTYLEDGDVAGDIYRYDTTFDNSYINILEWNALTQEIRGSFYINLARDKKYIITPGLPDTILVKGSFFTRITGFH
jgi:hypothetical protein